MRHRTWMSEKERSYRSKLAKLVHNRGLLRANLIEMARQCGKEGCHCRKKGSEHISIYAAQSYKGTRRMLCIPKDWEKRVQIWTDNHQQVRLLLNKLSELYWEKIRTRKA